MFCDVYMEKSGQEITCETGNEIIGELVGCLSKHQLTVEIGQYILREAANELEIMSLKAKI